jgi:hypothetical protein
LNTINSGNIEFALIWQGDHPLRIRRLQAGGREHSAKQKAFGTVLATAPSPAFYWAAKKPLSHMGGFFAALIKSGRREVNGAVF